MVGERVQRWAGAPTVLVGWWNVLWPTPPADGDFSGRSLGGDKVVERKAKVGLKDEEDLDEVSEFHPASGGSATESVDNSRGHDGGRRRREGMGLLRGSSPFIMWPEKHNVKRVNRSCILSSTRDQSVETNSIILWCIRMSNHGVTSGAAFPAASGGVSVASMLSVQQPDATSGFIDTAHFHRCTSQLPCCKGQGSSTHLGGDR